MTASGRVKDKGKNGSARCTLHLKRTVHLVTDTWWRKIMHACLPQTTQVTKTEKEQTPAGSTQYYAHVLLFEVRLCSTSVSIVLLQLGEIRERQGEKKVRVLKT